MDNPSKHNPSQNSQSDHNQPDHNQSGNSQSGNSQAHARPPTPLRRYRQLCAELGWGNAWLYALSLGLAAASGGRARLEAFAFVAQPVPGQPLLPPGRGASISVSQTPNGHAVCQHFPRPPEVIANRFQQGARCFTALRQGQFAGFLWLVRNAYDEDIVRCRFLLPATPATAWDFDVYVDPASRSGLAFARLWDSAYEWLRQQGCQWSLSRISLFNPASRQAHRRLGAQDIGWALFLCLGQAQLMLASAPPYCHLSWRTAAPTLRLRPPAAAQTTPLATP